MNFFPSPRKAEQKAFGMHGENDGQTSRRRLLFCFGLRRKGIPKGGQSKENSPVNKACPPAKPNITKKPSQNWAFCHTKLASD